MNSPNVSVGTVDIATRWQIQLSLLRRIAFDSNTFIYFLEDREPYVGYVAQAIAMMDRGYSLGFISTVVEMEILVKPIREQDTSGHNRAKTFLRERPILSVRCVDRIVSRRAADLRARTRLAPLDAIIVATGLEEQCDAIVGNDYVIASRSVGNPYLYFDGYIS